MPFSAYSNIVSGELSPSDGFALWAWGSGSEGQTGDNSSGGYQTAPFRIADSEWLEVSGGLRHTLVIRNDGTLWGCGDRSSGQLGFGDFDDDSNILSLVQIGTDTDWVHVLAQGDSSFGIKADGSLWSWGDGVSGQLGLPGIVGVNDCTFTVTQVGTDTDWVAVAGAGQQGTQTTFALKSDGTIWVTGSNSAGKQGRGMNGPFEWPDLEEFTQMGTDSDWAQIHRCWGQYMIALKTDGSLWGWGANGSYQLGGVVGSEVKSPSQIGSDEDWAWLAPGPATIVIKTDGSMYSCGYGPGSCLGNGSTSDQTTLTQVGTDSDWAKAWCGSTFVIAQKTDGSLWGWGNNNVGQLAQGAVSSPELSPIQLGSDVNWSIATSGSLHVIALRTTLVPPAPPPNVPDGAFGGIYTESGGYSIHTFQATSTLTVFNTLSVDYLIVGGGGAGGGVGGGGGGEVLVSTAVSLAAGDYTVGVGVGGAPGVDSAVQGGDGSASSFNGGTAAGGGGGGAYEVPSSTLKNGRDGASGGGGGMSISTAGVGGAASAGSIGGNGVISGSSQGLSGGGGGGSGGGGSNGSGTDEATGTGGAGGAGTSNSFSGTSVFYGAGGGGGGWTTGGAGGSSVGGIGAVNSGPVAANLRVGAPNTGSGGGGGFGGLADPPPLQGRGANGVVIVRYLTPP